ncbi:MAG: ribonuclease HI family protein [Phycisphaeraceae bacterium]
MRLRIHIDGGSRGNPGPAAVGIVIQDPDTSASLLEAGYFLGRTTNNVAEYRGLLRALEGAIKLGADEAEIISDSELMVRQMRGDYRVKSPDLKPLYDQARHLLGKLKNCEIRHVRREWNRRADELANLAIDAKRDVVVMSMDGLSKPSAAPGAGSSVVAAASAQASPRWVATLQGAPGSTCPAADMKQREFVFGPTTPAGMCVHAAQVALNNAPSPGKAGANQPVTVHCDRCGVAIEIRNRGD